MRAHTKLQRDDLKPGQKAALVIRLFYHDLSNEAEKRMLSGVKNPSADLHEGMSGDVAEILAKKVGMSRRNLYYLLAVYRNRPDLFELVFDGSYSINKAYTQMKADEAPEEVPQEEPLTADAKAVIERAIREEHMNPQIDESQPAHAPHNRIVQMRKNGNRRKYISN